MGGVHTGSKFGTIWAKADYTGKKSGTVPQIRDSWQISTVAIHPWLVSRARPFTSENIFTSETNPGVHAQYLARAFSVGS